MAELKDDVQQFLSVAFVAQVACELGLCWRETPLALPNLVALFARQILEGNLSMPELARRAGSRFTPEAYCTARGRLPLELLRELLRRVCALGDRAGASRGPEALEGPSPVACGRQQLLHARHPGTAGALRPAGPATQGLRLSRWPISCACSTRPAA